MSSRRRRNHLSQTSYISVILLQHCFHVSNTSYLQNCTAPCKFNIPQTHTVAMKQIYKTVHSIIVCQYRVCAFTDRGASNGPPVCNSFKNQSPSVRKVRLFTLARHRCPALSQCSEQLISTFYFLSELTTFVHS